MTAINNPLSPACCLGHTFNDVNLGLRIRHSFPRSQHQENPNLAMDAFADQARNLADRYEREAREEEDRKLMGVGSEEEDEDVDRMEVFRPVVQTLVGALGGYEVSRIRLSYQRSTQGGC